MKVQENLTLSISKLKKKLQVDVGIHRRLISKVQGRHLIMAKSVYFQMRSLK